MSEQSKLHPLTRFSEFEGDEGWIKKALGDLGYFTGGGTPSKSNTSYWQGNIPWVSSSDISDDSIHEIQITRFISEDALQESATKLVPKNSILLVSRVGVGKLAITLEPLCTSQDFTSFTPKRDNLTFLAYYLKSKSNTLLGYSQGMAIKGFTKDDISKLELFIPTEPKEQQKVADCLSSLDDLITAQNQKVEALKQHKKGLMQQLFPAEGETVPKLRFPEFRNKLGWDEKQLKNACDMQAGKYVQASEIKSSSNDGLYPCYGGNGLRGYTKTYTHEGTYSLIGRQGALCGNINLVSGLFHATEHALVTTPKNGVDTNWLFYKLELLNLNQYATGQAQPGLSVENLERVAIKIPRDLEEQQEIAKCLSALDKLINVELSKADLLKRHKKSLMQQLFPMLENGEK